MPSIAEIPFLQNLTPYFGEIAAFTTVICWTIGAQIIEAAGKRVGSLTVNLLRLVFGLFFLSLIQLITRGMLIPYDFSLEAWSWLLFSGFLGLFFGDMCLFGAFIEIGPRVSMLIMSLSAPLTALIGSFFLGEKYHIFQWCGMFITLLGVALVILERPPKKEPPKKGNIRPITLRGILLGLGAVLGQATGYVIGKYGMGEANAFAATQIRIFAALVSFAVLITFLKRWSNIKAALKDKVTMGLIVCSSFLGTTLGVALSLYALHYTTTGVASTIFALVPIFLIPFSIFLHKEHVSIQAISGAFIAFGGIILLTLF